MADYFSEQSFQRKKILHKVVLSIQKDPYCKCFTPQVEKEDMGPHTPQQELIDPLPISNTAKKIGPSCASHLRGPSALYRTIGRI